jgi:hypothetical protein
MLKDDTTRVAGTVRLAGELLEAHGELAWSLTEDWEKGVRSPTLQPSASDRYEIVHEGTADEFSARVPSNDRTGESAVDPLGGVETHTKLKRCLDRMYRDAAEIVKIIEAVVPPVPFDAGPLEWCNNHLRLQLCEPVHRGNLCRWCYDFNLMHRTLPPASLLGLRHRYGRVSEDQVKAALRAEKGHRDSLDKVNQAVRTGRRKAS